MYATLEAREIRREARYSLPDRQKLYGQDSRFDRRFLYAAALTRPAHELTVFESGVHLVFDRRFVYAALEAKELRHKTRHSQPGRQKLYGEKL